MMQKRIDAIENSRFCLRNAICSFHSGKRLVRNALDAQPSQILKGQSHVVSSRKKGEKDKNAPNRREAAELP